MSFNRLITGSVYEAYDGECFYCGMKQKPFDDWEVDHLIPRAQGGSDDLLNLVVACKRCNRLKGNRTVDEFKDHFRHKVTDHLNCALGLMYVLSMGSSVGDDGDQITHNIESAIVASFKMEINFPGEAKLAERLNSLSSEQPEIRDESDSLQ